MAEMSVTELMQHYRIRLPARQQPENLSRKRDLLRHWSGQATAPGEALLRQCLPGRTTYNRRGNGSAQDAITVSLAGLEQPPTIGRDPPTSPGMSWIRQNAIGLPQYGNDPNRRPQPVESPLHFSEGAWDPRSKLSFTSLQRCPQTPP